MRTEAGYKEAEIRRIRRLRDRELTVACLFLCALLFLILGILSITPGGITRFYRPVFIFIAVFSLYRYYPLQSSRWQLILGLYYFIIYICRQITGHSTETFISHELFILFFILAAGRRWSRREINLILDSVIFSCDVQAAVVLISNSFLLHAGSQQDIHYLWISTNRNPIAFAIVPGAVASLLKLIYCSKGWKTGLLRGYWIISFLLCTYDVFAIGCRSAFYSLGLGMACIVWERVKRTRNQAEKIRKQSEADCEQMLKDAESNAKQKEAQELKATEEKRNVAAQDMTEKAEKDAAELRAKASEKEAEAIDAVISKIL